MNQAVQLALAIFGLTSAYLAIASTAPWARRWSPVVGLMGQPAWLFFALSLPLEIGWPLIVTATAFTGVYVRGCWVQWRAA